MTTQFRYNDMSEGFEDRVRKRIKESERLSRKLASLIIFGSFIRGDYIPGLSDLDFFAVFEEFDEETYEKLLKILKKETGELSPKLIDLPYELMDNLSDPMNKGYFFKFLTFYQNDFLNNHRVIYGKEIRQIIPRYKQSELIEWRAEKMLSNAELFARTRPELLKVQAGEVAKFLAVVNGETKIDKKSVLKSLEKLGDKKAYKIYYEYVNEEDEQHSNEYYIQFIKTRLEPITNT